MDSLDPVLLSEEQGVEKPSVEIFQRACDWAGVQMGEVLHVGDELRAYVRPTTSASPWWAIDVVPQ